MGLWLTDRACDGVWEWREADEDVPPFVAIGHLLWVAEAVCIRTKKGRPGLGGAGHLWPEAVSKVEGVSPPLAGKVPPGHDNDFWLEGRCAAQDSVVCVSGCDPVGCAALVRSKMVSKVGRCWAADPS